MSSVINSESFDSAADSFRAQCTVPVLVQLAEENVATQPPPPYVAFLVPETSIVSALAKTVLESFRRYLAEPSNPPLFWLSLCPGAKDPVPWSTTIGLLAQQVLLNNHNHNNHGGDSSSHSHSSFPIKLYANFRSTKRSDLFPFHALHCTGAQLVEGLEISVLHALKRSVAIMNPDTFRDFVGELNPQDMKRLKVYCLMDSMSISVRTEFMQFHKGVLATITVQAWPVMIHSMESGRTLTLAVPAVTEVAVETKVGAEEQEESPTSRKKKLGHASSSSRNSMDDGVDDTSYVPAGIQGQFLNRAARQQHGVTSSAPAVSHQTRPAVFGDLVSLLAQKMMPSHLPQSEDGKKTQELLRRRLLVAGLPEAPLAETPLRWLMEYLVGGDLALHVALTKP